MNEDGGPGRVLDVSGILLLAVVLAAGCEGRNDGEATRESAVASEPQQGGTVVIGITRDFDAFNEFVSIDADTRSVMASMLFLPLVAFDSRGELRPVLAESWTMAPDGLSVIYRLRRDVVWHDSVPTTAEDVRFTYDRGVDPASGYPGASRFENYARATVLDPYTIRFDFTRPFADPVEQMASLIIMPRHLLETVPPGQLGTAEFNRRPIGNGPFRFVEWKANEEVVLEANPAFSPSLGGRPYLDRVVFRVIPEQSTAVVMLLNGEIDLLNNVPPADAARVEASQTARLITFPGRTYVMIAWNHRNPLFDSAEERRAMTLATDRQAMVDALLHGYGDVMGTHTDPTSWTHDPSVQPLPHDPTRARALLAEAGWSDSDGDGVLDQNGRRFEFELETATGSALGADLTVFLQAQLAEIGVVARPVLREWATLMEDVQDHDFDAFMTAFSLDIAYNPRDQFHSEAIAGENNWGSFSHPTVDSLIDLGLTIPDRERAKPVWTEFQRLLAAEQPYTWLFVRKERAGVSRRVRGLEEGAPGDPRRIGAWPAFGIRHWWIEQESNPEQDNAKGEER